MNTKKFHHKTISSFLAIIIFIVTFGLVIPSVQSESLVMTIDFAPSSIVIQGSSLQILIHSNNTVNLNISAKTTTKTCLLFSNITIEKNIQKEIIVPIVYPLDSNFTLVFDAENKQSTLIHQQTKDFFLEPSKSGNYSCKGRILNQGFVNKTGLEGAFIEVMSGPTYTYTYSEDDGYFSLDHLLPGPYKLRISHACTKVVKEYIVEVNEKSVFENIEMHPHRIPDFDFWMNKSSGSHYERGETATIYMRSRLNMEVNLFQITEEGEKPILLKCPLQANKIRRFYWVIPDDVNLGPLQFSMTPVGNEYCGSARYSIDIINSIQYGALEGYVLVNNKPIQGADVFFPYEYIPHTTTDQYGKFVFKDVKGGNYHLRCTMPGFEEKNLPHVDVIRGQINGPITLSMTPKTDSKLVFRPSRLDFTTHERREKVTSIICFLEQGFLENIAFTKTKGPAGIDLTPGLIPQLVQEKQILTFTIQNTVLPGEYDIEYTVLSNDTPVQTLSGTVQVLSLSKGTFDGRITPPGITIPQGGTADFQFHAEKFTNFLQPLKIRVRNLPSYTQLIMDTDVEYKPPCTIPFSIDTSLSTETRQHFIELEVYSNSQKNTYVFPLTVIPRKGQLETFPTDSWNPILSPGETASLNINCFSPNGNCKNVRVNKDFGPDWITLGNRDIGLVTQNPASTDIHYSPPEDILIGSYPYAISFTYGDNNEEYKKFSGRIYVQKTNPDSPINVRSKFIPEEKTVILTWNPPTFKQNEILGYNVYRSYHYPALQNTHPLNNTLLSKTEFLDTNFLYGQQYWYIVKAVFQDGSISSSSNTTQIIIPPKKEGAIIVSLDKPAGSSYFIGSPLNIHFQSTLSGKVSVSCQSGPLQVTLKESFITSGTRYSWTPILPELPDSKCMCTVSFESEGGYRDSRTFYFFCKPQLKGASVIRGTIRNQYSQEPVAGAIVQVSDGPTFASTTSQSDGTFTFKHMAHGSYTFSVEKNGFFFSFAADSIENSENVLSPWNIPLQESYQLLVWNEEPKVETNTIPLWFYTETEGYFSIYWRKDQIERTIYQQIEAYKQSTNHLQIPIANDIPSGTIQLIIENQTTNEKRDLFITLPDSLHTNHVTGFVKDYDGNPLSKAHVNEFAVNEWGYFRIPPDSLSEPIIVSAPFYEQKELSQEDVDTISTTYLEKNTGNSFTSQKNIFISNDFNQFTFDWIMKDGWNTISNFEIVEDPTLEPIYSIPSLECHPGYLYSLHYANMLQEQVTKNSCIQWTEEKNKENIDTKIPILAGIDDKLFYSTIPSIPVFFQSESVELLFDIYSYSEHPNQYLLSSSFPSPYKATISPSDLIPGNECKVQITSTNEERNLINTNQPILGCIIVQDQAKKPVGSIPVHFSLQEETTVSIRQPIWSQMLPVGYKTKHTFYISETPSKLEIGETPVYVETSSMDNKIFITITAVPEGVTDIQIPLSINNQPEQHLYVNIEGIPANNEWHAPALKCTSVEEGVQLSVQGLLPDNVYRIRRKEKEGAPEWIHTFTNQTTFVDKNVQTGSTYEYSLFTTDQKLVSGWSNTVSWKHMLLQIQLKIKQETVYTNASSILLEGTATPEAVLTLNSRVLKTDLYGRFSFNAPLKEGENKFVFQLKDGMNNSIEKTLTVYRDSEKPEIKILSPTKNPYYTKNKSVEIRLQTEIGSKVTFQNNPMTETSPGIFQIVYELQQGNNTLKISVKDKAGNQSETVLEIVLYKTAYYIQLKIGSNRAVVNGKTYELDVPPQVLSGRTVVPLRFIAESFGAEVEWVAETKEIQISFQNIAIQLQIGNNYAVVNGKTYELDVPPQVLSGRTVVPLRFIAESFGAEVEWVAETKEIQIRLYQ